jgi:hypothetical protein
MTRFAVPLITSLELSLPLAESEELWHAKTANEWKSSCKKEAKRSSTETTISLSEALRSILDDAIPSSIANNAKHSTILLYGLWHLVFEHIQSNSLFQSGQHSRGTSTLMLPARHQSLVRILSDIKMTLSHSSSSQTDQFSCWTSEQIESKLTCEYLLMSLHVPLESIEVLAGRFGDEEARNVYPALQE